ncbi:MAG: hypothetical protein DDT28_00283 [Dehalococcoidia bacterium]|nr:hypothetical protein [Chloroflexota bacterium]
MGDGNLSLGHQIPQPAGNKGDTLHPVVHQEDLSIAVQLPQNRTSSQLVVILGDIGFYGQARLRGGLHGAHVANPDERHMEGARDGSSTQREHIDFTSQLFQSFFVRHPEFLFLIYDDQPQILKYHVPLQQTVRPDADVHRAACQSRQHILLLPGRTKAAQHFDLYRKGGQPLGKSDAVLLGEYRGWHQDSHLHTIHHRLEGSPECNLGLAVAYIAAHQPIHWLGHLHILFYVTDSFQLIGGLHVWEGGFKLLLPYGIRRESNSRGNLP